MFKERLLNALSESELVESEKKNDDKKLKRIRKDFNESKDRFSKPQINQIRRNLYDIKKSKILSKSKIENIENNPNKLEERLSKLKKYYNYDDPEYRGIRDVGDLFNEIAFNQSIYEDYYKPITTKSAFNGSYIKYESKGDKDKNVSLKRYLYIIIPYLSDVINDHETPKKLRGHSGSKINDYKTKHGECNIQLTVSINFISSKDSDETCNMHTKSDNIEIMMGSETDEIIEEHFRSLLQRY